MGFPNSIQLTEEMIVSTAAAQRMPLGTRGFTNDGRVFRYSQAGATALTANKLVISAAQGPASTSTDQVAYEAYAVGTTYVKLSLSTVALPVLAADFFKDGFLVCNSTDVAYQQVVPVHGNEALVSSTALNQQTGIWLKQPGLKKLTATATGMFKLVQNPYKGVLVSSDGNGPGMPMGVTPCAVAASYFFWAQTWGPCLAHAGEGIRASIDKQPGARVGWSTGSTGGVCAPKGTATAADSINFDTDSGWSLMNEVGVILTCAPAANFFHLIDLRLSP